MTMIRFFLSLLTLLFFLCGSASKGNAFEAQVINALGAVQARLAARAAAPVARETSAVVAEEAAAEAVTTNSLGLPDDVAATFEGTIRQRVLEADVRAFRFSGGVSAPPGRFLTTRQTLSQISSPEEARRVLNLPSGATAEQLNEFIIPKGTEIFVGRIRGGTPGATQIFLKNPNILKPIK